MQSLNIENKALIKLKGREDLSMLLVVEWEQIIKILAAAANNSSLAIAVEEEQSALRIRLSVNKQLSIPIPEVLHLSAKEMVKEVKPIINKISEENLLEAFFPQVRCPIMLPLNNIINLKKAFKKEALSKQN